MRRTRKEFDTPRREDVQALIDQWFAEPHRESDGGFAPCTDDDTTEMSELIRALVKFRFGPDSDGDRPLRWATLNWTTHEPPAVVYHLQQEPRTAEEWLEKIRQAQANAKMAADTAGRVVDVAMMMFQRSGLLATGEPARLQRALEGAKEELHGVRDYRAKAALRIVTRALHNTPEPPQDESEPKPG